MDVEDINTNIKPRQNYPILQGAKTNSPDFASSSLRASNASCESSPGLFFTLVTYGLTKKKLLCMFEAFITSYR